MNNTILHYADSGLSPAAVGVIIVVIIIAVILTVAIAIVVIIALIITKKQRTYKVSTSIQKQRTSNLYTGVPSSPHSVSDDSSSMATTGTTNPTFTQSQAEEGGSKFTIDFQVADAEKN